jgi:squalene-associated FAD-dependent desaturase
MSAAANPNSASANLQQRESVAVVGGGLAGLAAACALAESGFRVRLFERRPYLGGRASSYQHPGTGEVVDNCQHVLLGCCTNLIAFYRRIGAENKIRWFDHLTFIEPGGRRSDIGPSFLPAPFHTAPSFLRVSALSLADKLAIARAMMALMRRVPPDDGRPFSQWLAEHGQTRGAIERFWKVVLVSALNEDLDRMSVHYAAQVFRESFLKSAPAGRMGVPIVPLTQLYDSAGDHIRRHGGDIELRSTVASFRADQQGVRLCSAGEAGGAGRDERFDFAVLAVPFNALAPMLPPDAPPQMREMLGEFETSPITGIHLWFDREITDVPHAVLLDRTIQWMFNKSKLLASRAESATASPAQGSYLELVVSSSKSLVDVGRNQIIELAVRELAEFFPGAAQATLVKSAVIKEVHATFSVLPGSDWLRLSSSTGWPHVFLAGDWTATGWPATMEGAVRSGFQAAEALTRAAGRDQRFLVPDLPARGLMRMFS